MVFGSRDMMGVRLLILRMIYTWETFEWGKGRLGILKENMGGGIYLMDARMIHIITSPASYPASTQY